MSIESKALPSGQGLCFQGCNECFFGFFLYHLWVVLIVFAMLKRKHVSSEARRATSLLSHFFPVLLQPSLPRGCSWLVRARRAPQPYMTKVPQTKIRTTASTTPRWTGGSSCATPGTWSQLSGLLCSIFQVVSDAQPFTRRSLIQSQCLFRTGRGQN